MPKKPSSNSRPSATRAFGLSLAVGRGFTPRRLFAVAFSLLLCALAFSAPAKPAATPAAVPVEKPSAAKTPAPAAATDEDKDRVIVERADKLNYDGTQKMYILEGNVRIRHKDVVLTCDYAEYHDDTDTADCRGHLTMKDPGSTVTGDTMHVDFTDEIAVIDGHVIIVTQKKKKGEEAAPAETTKPGVKPPTKPPATETPKTTDDSGRPHSISEAREKVTTIHCPHVKYRYTDGSRYAWITGPITAEQTDRTAEATSGEYDGEEHTLTLAGPVKVKTKDGNDFTAKTAVISTEEEWMKAEGIAGIAIRKPKTKGGTETAPATTPATAPTPPPATK
jgi:lipopolysaccharide export system protein LptA